MVIQKSGEGEANQLMTWSVYPIIFMAGQPTPPNVPPPRNKGLIRPY